MFDDMYTLHRILKAQTPREVKKTGQRIKGFDAAEWSREGKAVCYIGIKSKFEQHQLLNTVLQNTGSLIIVECTHDKLWGTGISLFHCCALDESLWTGQGWMSEILDCM